MSTSKISLCVWRGGGVKGGCVEVSMGWRGVAVKGQDENNDKNYI